MSENRQDATQLASGAPRKVRVSAFEIGLAVALTFAALVHLISTLSAGRDSQTANTTLSPEGTARLQMP